MLLKSEMPRVALRRWRHSKKSPPKRRILPWFQVCRAHQVPQQLLRSNPIKSLMSVNSTFFVTDRSAVEALKLRTLEPFVEV